jgi:hypothetical protein
MGVAQSLSASSSQIRGKSGRGDGCANAWWQRINKAGPKETPHSFTCIIASELGLLYASVLLRGAHQVQDSKLELSASLPSRKVLNSSSDGWEQSDRHRQALTSKLESPLLLPMDLLPDSEVYLAVFHKGLFLKHEGP